MPKIILWSCDNGASGIQKTRAADAPNGVANNKKEAVIQITAMMLPIIHTS
ncbi:hypothetical protein AusDCA_0400 [Desulfitobacterium sp. AusDCA]